jgi:putative ABC transport system ATP-binding protein
MLELVGVVKHFRGGGEEVPAIDGVNLRLQPGEMVALQGPSGSGKTTLLLLTAGLLAPDRGTIRYGGHDLAALSEQERSEHLLRRVGFIYQSPHLMPRVSALENAAMKLMLAGEGMRAAQRQAQPWLERVGLSDRLEHTPEQLSGGERQRVAIARALTADPELILADEPTGNLDSRRSGQIVTLLRSIAHEQRAAVLLVTHDAEAAALADRRLRLRDGRLLTDPTREPSRA